MKRRKLTNTIYVLLTVVFFYAIASCSEEIVPIEVQDRTALDSLQQEIAVVSADLVTAQIVNDSLVRVQQDLNDSLAALQAPLAPTIPVNHYTIQVSDGSQGWINNTRVASLAGAVVTVYQGTTVNTVTTDGTGLATFTGLASGFISVSVETVGFSDVYLVIDLRDQASYDADIRYASTQIWVFPTTGGSMYTLSGTSYYNQDLNNLHTDSATDPDHPKTGNQIYEIVPTGTTFLIDCTPIGILNDQSVGAGQIISATYAGLQRVATTDATGAWTITLPVVFDGTGGTQVFSYTEPKSGDQIKGTRLEFVPTPNTTQIWSPDTFWPLDLADIELFPGGISVLDLYYEPI